MHLTDLTPRDQDRTPPGMARMAAIALPWILLAVLALWALRR